MGVGCRLGVWVWVGMWVRCGCSVGGVGVRVKVWGRGWECGWGRGGDWSVGGVRCRLGYGCE